jgi:hypothetical protein
MREQDYFPSALIGALGMFGFTIWLGASMVTVDVTVVDENGKPIRNAEVSIPFLEQGPVEWGSLGKPAIGQTDGNGRFSASGRIDATYGASAKHPDYYLGWSGSRSFEAIESPRHLEAKIVLRPILNPIPLFARRIETNVPGVNGDYLFDLMVMDWVRPHGKGIVGDIGVRVTRRFESWEDFDCNVTWTFIGSQNGIKRIPTSEAARSFLKLPRNAPEDGYVGQKEWNFGRTKNDIREIPVDAIGYFFRIRSVVGEKGEIVSAHYGKILGDILVTPINSKSCLLRFTCYSNPTGSDRNLEFDVTRNLVRNLPSFEHVREP